MKCEEAEIHKNKNSTLKKLNRCKAWKKYERYIFLQMETIRKMEKKEKSEGLRLE